MDPIRLRINILREAYEYTYGPPYELIFIDSLVQRLKANRGEVTFQFSYLEEDGFLERVGWMPPIGFRLTDRGAEWLEREGDRISRHLDEQEADPLRDEEATFPDS
jgi:hypothetical protein